MQIRITLADGTIATRENVECLETFYCTGFERDYVRLVLASKQLVEYHAEDVKEMVVTP